MILIPHISGKTYAVLGLGKSGRAAVASLLASGAKVLAWDDKEASRVALQQEFAAVEIAAPDAWNWGVITALVVSPGIMLNHPAIVAAKRHHVEVLGDVELLYRAQPEARYVCITGTNGKSTTTTLIAHILQACGKRVQAGGNLGTAALALAPLGADGIYVLELSSYQLDLVKSTKFGTAILLNITPDHLDHHGSMEHYIAAKAHIFDRQTADDVAIIGVDDAICEGVFRTLEVHKNQRMIPISVTQKVQHGVWAQSGMLHDALQDTTQGYSLQGIKSLQGAHNGQNAAAAYAACVVNGCAPEQIMAVMRSYPGLAHRMQWLGEVAGVQFVNDSKATNADAAEKALLSYENVYWILGGVAKDGGIDSLAKYFPKIQHAYLIGEATENFAEILEGKVPFTKSVTLENAFYAAANAALKNPQQKPVVLLAPACASFDQFANFEVRGEAFVKLFDQWKGGQYAPAA